MAIAKIELIERRVDAVEKWVKRIQKQLDSKYIKPERKSKIIAGWKKIRN